MILTRDVLIEKIKKREIKISPFDERSIGPASIDLALDNKLRVFKTNKKYRICLAKTQILY